MTSAERALWSGLRRSACAGLAFRRQQVIDGFIADFYCHAARLIVELDGGVHEQQADYDRLRDEILTNRGLLIARYPNERATDHLADLVAEISRVALVRIEELHSGPEQQKE